MDTITKTRQLKVQPSFREDAKLIIGNVDLYDYYVVSPIQKAILLEEEEAILNRNHTY
jgi:hypothetical protein